MARKRAASGFKKGKHGSKRDIFEDIDEEAIRKDLRKSVRNSDSMKARILPYVVLVSVIGALVGGYVIIDLFLISDTDDPFTVEDTTGVFGLTLKVETITGEDGGHKPFDHSTHKVDPAVGTQYLLLVKNRGELSDSFVFTSNAPADWTVTFDQGATLEDVPIGEWMYKAVTVKLKSGASDMYQEIRITATSKGDPAISDSIITKNEVVTFSGAKADLAQHPAKVDYNLVYYGGGAEGGNMGWYHNQGSEFEASGVIQGFQEAVKGMRVGQTKVVDVPPEKGYGAEDPKHVDGKSLIFEITMLDVNTED